MVCDLHTHSIFSDGTDTPEALVEKARSLGLGAVALTDHNTVAGLPRFLAAAERLGIEGVPGVEFSTEWEGTELHILALWVSPKDYDAVMDRCAEPARQKAEANRRLAENLARDGIPIDYEALAREHPGAKINRAHFAAELVRLGQAESMKDAFRRFLDPERGYYTPAQRLDALETVAFIRSLGAAAVLAHPFLNLKEAPLGRFLREAKPLGLTGMETDYPKFDETATRLARAMAGKFGLLPSGGSDYHGANKPDIALGTGRGTLAVPMEYCQALKLAK